MPSIKDFSADAARLKRELQSADAVVIGTGAGLSASAGFVYNGERFAKIFSDFEVKYGFHDMYSGGFYPYASPEEYWAYWSRYIYVNRYMDAAKPVYPRHHKVSILAASRAESGRHLSLRESERSICAKGAWGGRAVCINGDIGGILKQEL